MLRNQVVTFEKIDWSTNTYLAQNHIHIFTNTFFMHLTGLGKE